MTIGVIAISLIGFILMDAGRSGLGGDVSPSDAVAEINGTKISWEAFQKKVKQNEELYQMNGTNVDEMTRQQILTDTWRLMVEERLMEEQYGLLGIDVSNKEFNDMLFGKNPPPWLSQQFTNEAGQFDAAGARQAINEIRKGRGGIDRGMLNDFYLEPLILNGKRTKYSALLQNASYVPKWMAEKTVADNGLIASMQFVSAPFTAIADSTVKVGDKDIEDYIKSHRAEYETDERSRSIAYVTYTYQASKEDSAAVYNELVGLKEDFRSTEDPGAFVVRNGTTLPFYDGYNSKNRIQIAQKDSIIGAGVGKVYGPYLDVNSYVISRVVGTRQMPDSVKAKHILIATVDQRSQQRKRDDASAKQLADSLEGLVRGGANFDSLAVRFSEDEGSARQGGDLGYFSTGTMVKEFNDFCFDKKTGDMGVVRTQFGYHLIRITDQKNFTEGYKIAYLSKPIDPSQATINDALLKANTFLSKGKNVKEFDDLVVKEKLGKMLAEEIKENDYQVGSLGMSRDLVKRIFDANVGEVLEEPIEIGNQFVVVAVTGEEKSGLPSVRKMRPIVENIVRNELKGKALQEKLKGATTLEEAAKRLGKGIESADSIAFTSPVLPGAGYELKAAGFGFNKANVNKLSPAIIGTGGVYMVKPLSLEARPDASADVEAIRQNLMNQQRGVLSYTSMEAHRKAATIKDKRSKFM